MYRARHLHDNVQNTASKNNYEHYVHLLRGVKRVSPKSGPVILINVPHSKNCKDYSPEQRFPESSQGIRGYISVMAA